MKTDTAEQAITSATAHRSVVVVPPSVDVWPADGTHMVFFTEAGKITCQASLYVQTTGGNGAAEVSPKHVVKFAMEDALPADLLSAAQLIQAYLHNHACELIGAV